MCTRTAAWQAEDTSSGYLPFYHGLPNGTQWPLCLFITNQIERKLVTRNRSTERVQEIFSAKHTCFCPWLSGRLHSFHRSCKLDEMSTQGKHRCLSFRLYALLPPTQTDRYQSTHSQVWNQPAAGRYTHFGMLLTQTLRELYGMKQFGSRFKRTCV